MTEAIQLEKIQLLGTQLTLCNSQQLLETIEHMVHTDHKGRVVSGNVYSFNLAYQHKWLRDFFNQADIVRLDGTGVRLGAKILGYTTPKRMTWADFAWQLAELAQLFADDTVRLITILGPGDTGKTRLALEAAGSQLDNFMDGVYFVPLASLCTQCMDDDLIATVADVVGCQFARYVRLRAV